MAKTVGAILALKDKLSAPMTNAAKSVDSFNKKAKLGNTDTKKLAKSMKSNLVKGAKVAGTALVGLGAAMGATAVKMVNSTTEYADNVDKMSQKIGISSKAYQEWDYAMGQSGVNISVMKNGMKTMSNLMVSASEGTESAQDAFKKLNVSIYDSGGKLKNQESIMGDAIKSLAGMKSGTERAALASSLFGKAGSELAPLLNSGTAGINDLIDRANELGLVMDQDTINAGVKLGDTMDDVKQTLSRVGISIGADLMPYFQKFSDYVIDHLPEIRIATQKGAKAFTKFGDAIKWVYDHSNILVPILGAVVAGVAAFKIISTISTIMTVFNGIMALTATEGAIVNTTLLACPLTWVVIGVMALVGAGIALYKNWDTVCKWASKLKKKFDKLIAPIKKVASWLGTVFGFSGKSVDVNVNNKTKGATPKTTVNTKHATGTSYFKGGYTGYSEGGRQESAILPSGTKIIPASKTNVTEKNGVTVYLTVQGNMIGDKECMKKYAEYTARQILKEL